MNQLELTPRLAAVASLVPQGARLADIGTDHAYLPAWLLLQGRIPAALAADINQGPLDRGRETARVYGVADRITFRRTDGLQGIGPEDADCVAICGMGGELIARILREAPWTKTGSPPRTVTLILQPMSTQPELRRWLLDNGYVIRSERTEVEGDKVYVILQVTGGEEVNAYTPGEMVAGRQRADAPDPHRAAYLRDLIRRRERAVAGMRQGRDTAALQEAESLLAELKTMLKEWQAWQP